MGEARRRGTPEQRRMEAEARRLEQERLEQEREAELAAQRRAEWSTLTTEEKRARIERTLKGN